MKRRIFTVNENIKAFLEKVAADQELQAKFAQIKDVDEAYSLASSLQSGFTKEEFVTEMRKIKEAMDENLSDEDLAKSAGGMDDMEIASLIAVSAAETLTLVCSATAAVGAAI